MNLLDAYEEELNEKCKLGDVEWWSFTGFTSSAGTVKEKENFI